MPNLPTLRRGSSSAYVPKLQEELRKRGWDTGAEAGFGLQTEAAVRCFQREHHLTNDGVVGWYTWNAIANAAAVPDARRPVHWVLSDVRYRSQRDNVYVPNGTCNVTSLATVLSWAGVADPPGKQLEDALFEELQTSEARAYFEAQFPWAKTQNYNPRNVHGMLTWLAKRRGLSADFTMSASWDQVVAFARKRRPVIQCGAFTGTGHILTLVGETTLGDPIVHDPFGDWQRGYRRSADGEFRIYDLDSFESVRRPWAHWIGD